MLNNSFIGVRGGRLLLFFFLENTLMAVTKENISVSLVG